jgi:TM2 domain-containing membrane protein YozV
MADVTPRVVAAFLAILAGTFGIHKFYLGKRGQGILCLVFWWTGIPTVVGWIEGASYLSASDKDFERWRGGFSRKPRTFG